METIKVNMTPCEDIKTVHASQNDNEAREWGFELHNNGEKIDSSSISDQLVFKAYKGGTEEILPTNGSTPTTSPFKGDIKYPQGLLSDQEFLYRESPTEEDGLAWITDIKGNTLVWNQLQPNNISRTNNGITYTYDNGKLTVTGTATSTSWWLYGGLPVMNMKANHKYLFVFGKGMADSSLTTYNWYLPSSWQRFYTDAIITINNDTDQYVQLQVTNGYTIDAVFYPQVFDLTLMFGGGNEPTSVEEFRNLFPLDYYPFNSGSLIPFNGNGIKTVGFNQWDEEWEAGALSVTDGSTINVNSYLRSKNFIPVISGKTYCRGISYQSDCRVFYYDANHSYIGNVATSSANTLFTIPSGVSFIKFHKNGANYDNNICINISSDRNGTYEPYTSSLLNLPISTYFPNGMKSAGNVYDELTESKAITRVGSVDLGSLSWFKEEGTYITGGYCFTVSSDSPFLPQVKKPSSNSDVGNILCGKYQNLSQFVLLRDGIDKTICLGTGTLRIIDKSYTDATSFKTAMNGVYLYYELATPTETEITTASLVTENGEIPLSNEDGVLIGKCTEELSSESGFFNAKIKLADEDGECYSNKIQLHVERSPQ